MRRGAVHTMLLAVLAALLRAVRQRPDEALMTSAASPVPPHASAMAELDILWITAGLSCDGDTVSMTADDDDYADLELPGDGRTPADLLIEGAEAQSVRECVETLEGGSKQAIALAFFQGLTHAELASHLNEPLGTIKGRMRLGMEKVRAALAEGAFDGGTIGT